MPHCFQQPVQIPVDGFLLNGILCVPEDAIGMVIFSHGSGSSHKSPRNQYVADVLQQSKLGTLLFDLLTPYEDQVYANRFNIPLLSERLFRATCWMAGHSLTGQLPIAYFGASTGAASALIASVRYTTEGCTGHAIRPVAGIISRGGRPDMAAEWLFKVTTPVLCIVGGEDADVISLNKSALKKISSDKKLLIIPGATHLFEEPGTLAQMAIAAREWLLQQFGRLSITRADAVQ